MNSCRTLLKRYRRHFVILAIAAACLAVYLESLSFNPSIRFSLVAAPGKDGVVIYVESDGFRPIWIHTTNGILTTFKARFIGHPSISSQQVQGYPQTSSEWSLLHSKVPALVPVPEGVTHIHLGTVVSDWRGRTKEVWSDETIPVRLKEPSGANRDDVPESRDDDAFDDD